MKLVEKGGKIIVVGSHYRVNVSAILCIEVGAKSRLVLGPVIHLVKNFLCGSI
jgi:hypothetical protein